jgi:organic hydroperoxide reductase OsmC/OhrA
MQHYVRKVRSVTCFADGPRIGIPTSVLARTTQRRTDTTMDLQVNIGESGAAWFLGAKFTLRIPGVDQAVAEALAHSAHQMCPYSQATKGNIEVVTEVITA